MSESLEDIKKDIEENLVCELKDNATNLVFGKGNPNAEILFVGEAPGGNEDKEGLPFVGRAGKQLDTLLQDIDLTIDDVYIANILKYRPPKNRDPTTEEIKNHTPYLLRQIKVIQPKVIVTLGNYATKFVMSGFKPEEMKKVQGISKLHGNPVKINFNDTQFIVIPIYHPAAMLYRPQLRETFSQDFKVINTIVEKMQKEN